MTFCESLVEEYMEKNLTCESTLSLMDIYFENKDDIDSKFEKFMYTLKIALFNIEDASFSEARFIRFLEKQSPRIYDLIKDSAYYISPYSRNKYKKTSITATVSFVAMLLLGVVSGLASGPLLYTGAFIALVSMVIMMIYTYLSHIDFKNHSENMNKLLKELRYMKKLLSKVPSSVFNNSEHRNLAQQLVDLEDLLDDRIRSCELFI